MNDKKAKRLRRYSRQVNPDPTVIYDVKYHRKIVGHDNGQPVWAISIQRVLFPNTQRAVYKHVKRLEQ